MTEISFAITCLRIFKAEFRLGYFRTSSFREAIFRFIAIFRKARVEAAISIGDYFSLCIRISKDESKESKELTAAAQTRLKGESWMW